MITAGAPLKCAVTVATPSGTMPTVKSVAGAQKPGKGRSRHSARTARSSDLTASTYFREYVSKPT
jgi:hypothetical protein